MAVCTKPTPSTKSGRARRKRARTTGRWTKAVRRRRRRSPLDDITPQISTMRMNMVRGLTLLVFATVSASAQITEREFAARRASLARRIDSGVVIAFGGRTLVADFGTFFQLPA